MTRVLVVGCGCTGALVSSLLKRSQCHHNIDIEAWDKARGAGGRMSSSRRPQNGACLVDLGVQYITKHASYDPKHNRYYEELLKAGVLAPLMTDIENMSNSNSEDQHFVTPEGASSLVKHFLHSADVTTHFGRHLSSLNKKGDAWVATAQDGATSEFDAVVVTIPVPQILSLRGDVQTIIDGTSDVKANLEKVDYSSRYALGLFFDEGAQLNEQWAGKYISNHPIFRFVAIDNKKRNKGDLPPSVVFHTSVPFGKKYIENTPGDLEPMLLEAVTEMFPHWPAPVFVKTQKWRYSQVSKPYAGAPSCVVVSEKPLLILAGDGFIHSNFDGCIESAEAVVSEFTKRMDTKDSA